MFFYLQLQYLPKNKLRVRLELHYNKEEKKCTTSDTYQSVKQYNNKSDGFRFSIGVELVLPQFL